MAKLDQNFYMVRTSRTHIYECGADAATPAPKLYTEIGAKRAMRYKNAKPIDPLDGPWEYVAVEINVLGIEDAIGE